LAKTAVLGSRSGTGAIVTRFAPRPPRPRVPPRVVPLVAPKRDALAADVERDTDDADVERDDGETAAPTVAASRPGRARSLADDPRADGTEPPERDAADDGAAPADVLAADDAPVVAPAGAR